MKKILIIILITAIITGGIGFVGGSLITSLDMSEKDIYFEDPEEVVINFFEGLNNNNTEKTLRYFGKNYRKENFDYEAFSEYLGAINNNGIVQIPNSSKLYEPFADERAHNGFIRQVHNLILYLNLESDGQEVLFGGALIQLVGNEDLLDDVIEAYEVEEMSELELKEIYMLDIDSEKYEDNTEERAELFNCKTFIDLVVFFEYDNDDFVITMELAESEVGYYIQSLSSAISGANSFGVPMDKDYGENLIEDGTVAGKYELIWEED